MKNNARFNSSRGTSFTNYSNTDNDTKGTLIRNGGNIIMKDLPLPINDNKLTIGTPEKINPYIVESKINDLESKLSTLEEANKILIERLNSNEKNFQTQLKEIQLLILLFLLIFL